MSTWIQENKPSIIAGGIGIVLFAGLIGAGIYASLQESDIHASINSANDTMRSHADEALPPTSAVLKDLKEQLREYEMSMKEASEFFAPFRATSVLGEEDGQSFQNSLKQERDTWLALCKSKNVTVKNEASWMGFDAYRASAPQAQAAPMLSFQKLGVEYFLSELATSGTTTISSVYRAPLASEQMDAKAIEKPSARAAKKATPSYILMPFEVSFIGERQSLSTFLNALTISEKYFFTINAIRVKNEKQNLPVINVPKAEAAATQPMGLSLPSKSDNKKEEDASPTVEEILKPLIGSEKVQVRIAANLVFFPKVQEAKSKSE